MAVGAERHQGQTECCQIKLVAEKDYELMHLFYVYITQSAVGPWPRKLLLKTLPLFVHFQLLNCACTASQ